jgi:c-di-GMP-binding flagellar brake protein YcgR
MAPVEKRQFSRLTLQVQDGYFAHFLLPDQSGLAAPIINLSEGGLKMVVNLDDAKKLHEGDKVLLQNIAGGISLDFLTGIRAQIRWIKSLDHPTYVCVGCRFADIPAEVHGQLAQFIHAERMGRGQYD